MARGFVKNKGLTRDTLLKIAEVGAIVVVATTSLYFLHQAVRGYFKEKTEEAIRARARKLREMEKHKLISFRELSNGTVRIELTHKGKNLVRMYNLEKIKIIKPKKWDGKWRILIYDIPSAQRKASDAFREKIKQLGLFPLQKSVWVSPYECMSEVEFLASVFEINIENCICYFLTHNVPKEKEIKQFFGL